MSDVCPDINPSHPKGRPEGIESIYWLAKAGKSRPTGFKWRLITTVNVTGKFFVTEGEIVRFWQRAKNVEFVKKPRAVRMNTERKESLDHDFRNALPCPTPSIMLRIPNSPLKKSVE
jgi:hypothetical protein